MGKNVGLGDGIKEGLRVGIGDVGDKEGLLVGDRVGTTGIRVGLGDGINDGL